MKLDLCKSIVQTFIEQLGGFGKHLSNKQLVVRDMRFRIKPDDAYIYNDRVLIIEYENTKRPVESISKYWWLFEKNQWKSLQVKMCYCIFLLGRDSNEIRRESILILGRELSAKYPDLFFFYCLDQHEISETTIITFLEKVFYNQ
jgi:hypothetical protein